MEEENQKLADDPTTVTEPGLLRAAFISFMAFFALGSNPGQKNAELKELYPLLVRNGWDADRSISFNATHLVKDNPEDNAKHVAAVRTIMSHATSAPFPVHYMITRLYQLGIVAWEHGAYDQSVLVGDEGRFCPEWPDGTSSDRRQTLPLPSAFDKQAEGLRKHFEECHSCLIFAEFAAKVYLVREEFSRKMMAAKNKDAREAIVVEMRRLSGETAFAVYQAALEKIKYEPFDLDGFEETSPDFSAVQMREMKRIQDNEL